MQSTMRPDTGFHHTTGRIDLQRGRILLGLRHTDSVMQGRKPEYRRKGHSVPGILGKPRSQARVMPLRAFPQPFPPRPTRWWGNTPWRVAAREIGFPSDDKTAEQREANRGTTPVAGSQAGAMRANRTRSQQRVSHVRIPQRLLPPSHDRSCFPDENPPKHRSRSALRLLSPAPFAPSRSHAARERLQPEYHPHELHRPSP